MKTHGKNFRSTGGPTRIPTSFRDNLFAEPKQRATSPDPGLPHANAPGGSAGTGNSAESPLREVISAIGSSSNRASHGPKVKEAETLRFPEFPTPDKYRSPTGELQSAKKFVRRLTDQMMPGHGC